MNFTEEETKTIQETARRVWEYIGHDYLELGGKSIPRKEVVEVVIDAGRLEQEIKRKNPELAKKVGEAGPELEKIVTKAFSYARYGY